MADIILGPIAELLAETLGPAGVKKIKSLSGARRDLSKLENTLSTIRAVLVDAEKQQIRNTQVRDWLEKLEAVLYDADDLVDEVNSEGLRRQLMTEKKIRKKVRIFFSYKNQLAFQHKLAGKIKKIRERLDDISADKNNFHFATSLPEETKVRDSQSFVVGENVVGRNQDRGYIVDLLLDHESRTKKTEVPVVPVIPIVGIGGLGKTTLAQLVYNDERVQQHFDVKIWVCVSYNSDVKVICQKIVVVATSSTRTDDPPPMEVLQKKLIEIIGGKRYLLVLDDVWNLEGQDWGVLRDLLTKNCREGSGVIVTTRHRWVAEVMGTMQPYDLGILDPKDSWNLFKKMAFEPGRDSTNPTTEGIAKQILAKCGGVPLAITMIGRMLRFEDPETEWPSFLERDLPNITQQGNEILQTLRLSYDYLPSPLKPCFAYCSLFPKGHEIDVQELILLWIAQGFIKPEQSTSGQTLEEIAYSYFKALFLRSFFQEAERDRLKGFIKCKMHDVVHDLAILISGRGYKMLSSGEANLESHVRHISLDFNLKEFPPQWVQAERLRSLLLPIQSYNFIPTKGSISDAIISKFRFLRMLTLRNLGLELVPSSVSDLKHLRYLDLSGNFSIKELPTSITELVNLQTLKLTGCYNLLRLPEEISKLVNLRHLEFDESDKITHTPRGLGQLTNLQTLSQLVLSENPCSGKLDELKQLKYLRGNLTIKGLKNGLEPKEAKLKDKQHLQSLCLDFTRRGDDALTYKLESETTILEGLQPCPNLRELTVASYGGDRFSSWLSSLTNLVKLCLKNCSRCQQLPSLDQCNSLEELELIDLDALAYIADNMGHRVYSSSRLPSVLPSLQKLTLVNLPKFKAWSKSSMEFPEFYRLSSLTISSCPSLLSKPFDQPFYQCLEKMEMEFTSFERTTLIRDPRARISAATTTDQASSSAASSSTTLIVSLSFYPLSELLSLSLDGIVDLHHFPDEWMNDLASLKILRFTECHGLNYLTPYIHYLTSLEELEIANCQRFKGIEWPETPARTSLCILKLTSLPDLENLPSQGIQYLTSLEKLEIAHCQRFEGIEWPETPARTSLRILKLERLPELKNLPSQGIQYLTSLEELEIADCKRFEGIEWPETPARTSLRILKLKGLLELKNLPSQGIQYLTSLEKLEIADCRQFEGIKWPNTPALTSQRIRILKLEGLPELKNLPSQGIQYLTSLEELEIANCQRFEGIEWPETPARTSLRILKLTLLPDLENLPSQGIQYLTSLEELQIAHCKQFEGIEWPSTAALTSLRILRIVGLPQPKKLLSQGIQYLTSLEKLEFSDCRKLDVYDDSIQWTALTNLRTLEFAKLPQLRTLPKGLQSVTTLEDLQIRECCNFTGLQQWIHKLSSLQRLTAYDCPNFKLVPGSISSLTYLQHLEINHRKMDPTKISGDLDPRL